MSVTVKCPNCNTEFSATINMQTTCRNKNCKAILHIDNNGEVKKYELPKKKK